jgi:hypothetical protein
LYPGSPGWGTFGFFRLRVWLVFVSVVGCGGVLVSMLGFELCGSSARYADVACVLVVIVLMFGLARWLVKSNTKLYTVT